MFHVKQKKAAAQIILNDRSLMDHSVFPNTDVMFHVKQYLFPCVVISRAP